MITVTCTDRGPAAPPSQAPPVAPAAPPTPAAPAPASVPAPTGPVYPIATAPTDSFPMAVPFECMTVPTSLGANPDDLCAPADPAAPAPPVPAVAAAPGVAGVPAVPAPPQVTAGLVAEALRRVPLPAPVIEVQPPNGRTLVNFDTNFYTEAGDLDRTITLLGQQVDLQISAASYTWVFGDGQSLQTTSPGAAYPQLDVTHRYLGAGGVQVRVDVTYTAQFSVNGGPFAPVPGSVTVAGGSEPLQVVEARPTLVG